ncbi:glycosyltransferase family 2 protein [Halotia branconii]|uniref:Glycosyltransferase family 2 protein n=1 Tax=Halotia branconii CENA392 TaxID=1539056 RepID=A0AAJ6NWH9_9CYAN|nr:glycosyltransferase family 2 protein [Halotia branconii]WGV27786.1 glycosyltransferase family 2 protein [Halotia branconii CENA392]
MNPEVSIIIPAYNTEKYIAQAIESALGQTIKNIEVIVVDDASTDSTLEVIKSISDPRLKVLVNQPNQGVSHTRNCAIEEAKGKWIAVLDSDDWYAPERIEKFLQVAQTQSADIVIDDLYFIQDGEKSPWSTLLGESGEQINALKPINATYFVETDIYRKKGLHLGISKPLFKRDFLLKNNIQYDRRFQGVEDFHLMLQCLIKDAYLIFIPQAYYFYRTRPGSLVTQSKLKFMNQLSLATKDFLYKDVVKNNPQLVQALSQNIKVLEQNKVYYSVVEPLKQKNWLKASFQALRNPYFFIHLIGQIQPIFNRRFKYYFFKQKLV